MSVVEPPEMWWSPTYGLLIPDGPGRFLTQGPGPNTEVPWEHADDAVRLVADPTAYPSTSDDWHFDYDVYAELRLTGQPPGNHRPYDVTVPSNRSDSNGERRWDQLVNVARLARGLRTGFDGIHAPWADVEVSRRSVITTRAETDWEQVPDGELDTAADDSVKP